MRSPASPKNNHHYNKKLRTFANNLRKSMTKSEAGMWKYLLRAKTCYGYSFRRQRPILNYIADFCCFELMLVIEIDGITHDSFEAQQKDKQRDAELKAIGFHTLRFSSFAILYCMDEVSECIALWIEEKTGVKIKFFETEV